jgi:chromate reductase, NAD(P)H dehydrogenase (quinone)
MRKVAVIVGSIRKDSINKTLARALAKLADGKLVFDTVQIDDLPLFNQDNEAAPTAAVIRMKAQIKAADAILFVTPEHNRSIPAALKNAIDWASRPPKDSALVGKVGAIIGASRGRISTAVAQSHLKTIIGSHLHAVLGVPEAYIQFTDTLIDADANVTDESAKKVMTRFIENFTRLVDETAKS